MDNQHRNYYDYLQSSRIRSKRTRERKRREHRDKQLLQVDRERHRLRRAWWKREWVDLHPPIMRGYKRYFVLREDVAAGKQANFYQGILDKINTVHYSSRKDFKVKKRRLGKKVWKAKEQQLRQPDEGYFRRLQFTAEQSVHFEERYSREKQTKRPGKIYVFREPWRFVLRVRPNLITKMQVHDAELQAGIKRIDNYLWQTGLRYRLDKITYQPAGVGEKKTGPQTPGSLQATALTSIAQQRMV